jgi:hypothetical protein
MTLRTAASSWSTAPAMVPSNSRGMRSAGSMRTSLSPRRKSPGGIPATAIASVTRATRSPAAAKTNRIRPGRRGAGRRSGPGCSGRRLRVPGHTWLTVAHRGLCVEQVRHQPCAGVGGGRSLVGRGSAVPDAHDNPGCRRLPMAANACGRSGARVTTSRTGGSPRPASRTSSQSSVGSTISEALCAPACNRLRKGPSRSTPRMRAAREAASASRATTAREVDTTGAVDLDVNHACRQHAGRQLHSLGVTSRPDRPK